MKYKRLYIAYGSDINLEQMAYRCPNSKVVETTMIPGYELEFRGVATIVPKEGAEVPVLLWKIDQRDELCLDKYEGFPRMYRKEIFEVKGDGKIRENMAYLMNYGEITPPSPMYYNGIRKDYENQFCIFAYFCTFQRRPWHISCQNLRRLSRQRPQHRCKAFFASPSRYPPAIFPQCFV